MNITSFVASICFGEGLRNSAPHTLEQYAWSNPLGEAFADEAMKENI